MLVRAGLASILFCLAHCLRARSGHAEPRDSKIVWGSSVSRRETDEAHCRGGACSMGQYLGGKEIWVLEGCNNRNDKTKKANSCFLLHFVLEERLREAELSFVSSGLFFRQTPLQPSRRWEPKKCRLTEDRLCQTGRVGTRLCELRCGVVFSVFLHAGIASWAPAAGARTPDRLLRACRREVGAGGVPAHCLASVEAASQGLPRVGERLRLALSWEVFRASRAVFGAAWAGFQNSTYYCTGVCFLPACQCVSLRFLAAGINLQTYPIQKFS